MAREKLRVAVLAFIIACSCAIAFYLWPGIWRGATGAEGPIRSEQPGEADVNIGKMRLIEMNGDRKEWEVEATSASMYGERGLALLADVVITFYPEQPEPITVRGDHGTFYNETRDFLIEGNVVVTPIEGYTAYTRSVQWLAATQLIATDDQVRAVKPGSELHGRGMRAHAQTRRLQILHSVEARFH